METEIVKAASGRGWEAMMLAFIMLVAIGFMAWLIKQWLYDAAQRERRLSDRIDVLEAFQREQLMRLAVECKEALDRTLAAVDRFSDALALRPCMLEQERRDVAIRAAGRA